MAITAQEIYTKARNHLLTQMKPARGPDTACIGSPERCMYRSPEGLKCAFGIFIPDDKYRPEMEGVLVDVLFEQKRWIDLFDDFKPHLKLIERLQSIHDQRSVSSWETDLDRCAKNFGLAIES